MADEVGLKVTLDGKEVERGAKKAGDAIEKTFKRSATKAVSSVRKISNSIFSLKGAVAGIAFGFATKQVIDFGKELIKAGSDAEETANKFNVVFKGIGDDALKATNDLRKGFGLANEESQKLLSNTADILTGFGFTKKSALELSIATQKLAGDLGSFNNLSTTDASERLTKALTGEVESLKALGIVIRQDTKEYKDLVKSIEITQGVSLLQAKALANIKIATDQSKNAIGDFSRSIDSFANQSRIATSRFKDMKVELGQALLPVANQVLRETIIPAMDDLSKKIVENKDNIQEFATKGVEFLKSLEAPASALLSILSKSADGYIKLAKVLEAYNVLQDNEKKVLEAYKAKNRTLQQQAIILTDLQSKLAIIEDRAPSVARERAIYEVNRQIEEQTMQLNKLSEEYRKVAVNKKDAEKPSANNGDEVKKVTSGETGDEIARIVQLTKVENDYIEALNSEFIQLQFLKDLSGQLSTESLEGRALAVAQLQQETAELKTQAELKITDKETLEATLTAITEREEKRKNEIRGKYNDIDKAMTQATLDQNLGALSNLSGALKNASREYKAFAIADIIVKGAQGLAAAYTLPPPANFIQAAAVGINTGSALATVNSANYAEGTEYVRGSGGPRTDSVKANISVGERVFTNGQNNQLNGLSNDDVVDIVNGGGNSLGIISDLFTKEEIAQRVYDHYAYAEQIGGGVTS
jgi:hypothetical protein